MRVGASRYLDIDVPNIARGSASRGAARCLPFLRWPLEPILRRTLPADVEHEIWQAKEYLDGTASKDDECVVLAPRRNGSRRQGVQRGTCTLAW